MLRLPGGGPCACVFDASFSSPPCVAILSTGAHAGTLTSATWVTDLGFTGLGPPASLVAVPISASGTSTATSVSLSLSVPPFSTGIFLPKGPYGAVDLHFKFTVGGVQAVTATPSMARQERASPAP